jgi:hypothetical protein
MGDIFKGGVLFDNSKQTGNGKINFVPDFWIKTKKSKKRSGSVSTGRRKKGDRKYFKRIQKNEKEK